MVHTTKARILALALVAIATVIIGYKSKINPIIKAPIPPMVIGLPLTLQIPKLNIDSTVEEVGITKNQEMETPAVVGRVGWYKLGVRPGQYGSAVIAGHYDTQTGGEGVFYNLVKLVSGDEVIVVDNNGNKYTYIVVQSRTFDPGYADSVFNPADQKYLNLITCDGAWDIDKNSYNKRLVIFTVMRD
jgi:LPXTG-site transpeptidase (sortase) family protein